jgi:hypothetical protein
MITNDNVLKKYNWIYEHDNENKKQTFEVFKIV